MDGQLRPYRVVQPWGKKRAEQATVVSSHDSAVDAFAAIDAMAERMARTGAPAGAVELIVVDASGVIVERPES
jgi:hypothetical protein